MLTTSQRQFLEGLLDNKVKVLCGPQITAEIKALVAAGYVREAAVNISECGYKITEEGRRAVA